MAMSGSEARASLLNAVTTFRGTFGTFVRVAASKCRLCACTAGGCAFPFSQRDRVATADKDSVGKELHRIAEQLTECEGRLQAALQQGASKRPRAALGQP